MTSLTPAVWLLVVSPFVGSFLGVLADRLPTQRDVLFERSRCRTCKSALQFADLIPLLSYLILRGKCRKCGTDIPRHLFWAEVVSILIACAAVYCGSNAVQIWLAAGWMWCLLALVLADATSWRLPDPLTLALAILGIGLGLTSANAGMLQIVGSATIAAGVFWLIRLAYFYLRGKEGLGAGDVKLMVGIGAAIPITALPTVTLLAALTALGVAWFWPGVVKTREGSTALPFGAFLAGAAAIVWVGLNLP